MPPKQSAEGSQQSDSSTPKPAKSRPSAMTVRRIEELYFKPVNEHYRRELPKIIYYEELETIRQEHPIVNPKDAAAPVVTVKIWERPEAVTEHGITAIGDDDAEECNVKFKPLPFKMTAAVPRGQNYLTTSTMRTGGNMKANSGLVRLSSTHDFTAIRKQLGYKRSIDDHFGRYKLAATTKFSDRYSNSDPANPISDPDRATMLGDFDWSGFFQNHKRYFRNDPDPPAVLYKGFPMVEKVVFVMHPNEWHLEDRDGKHMDDGHCYWTSVALLIYGSASFWLLVKAEHLWYLESIVNNPHHPRHDFYRRMMETKFTTKAEGMQGPGSKIEGEFNLWEALHIPSLWVNDDPCYLTADLYKIFLVLYKYDSPQKNQFINKVYDMRTFGAYNSRHVFLWYAHGNHYRPMLPNDYLSYEFRLPRPTLAATKMYKLQTAEHNRPVDGLSHHWRAPLNSIPSSLMLPRGPNQDSVTESHIYRVVGYDPPGLPAPARPKRKYIVIDEDDDDDPKPPSPKHARIEKAATPIYQAEATKPRSPTPTPTAAPKTTTPVKYFARHYRLPSPTVLRPPRPLPIPNCPVVIPPVGKAFEALCGELDEAETTQGQTTSTALITRGPFGLTALSSRPPPDLTKLYTYFPHYNRQLLDSFYAWLIQPENIVKPVHHVLDALELGNQQFEQAKNPALAIRNLLGPTADIAAVVTLLTRYDFRMLLEFYSYEMKVENKAGKSAAQLLHELERGNGKWTKSITAPKHSGVHPGIIYTLEMMLSRYDPVLLADMAQWAKLFMAACAQAGQSRGLEIEKKWNNEQLVQLLEEKHQQREEVKRVERETQETKRRVKDRLEQQDRVLAQHREWEARYFREQFWAKMNTMDVEMTGRLRGENEMDMDQPGMGTLGITGIDAFTPGPPPEGTVPMDMGPDVDMDADGDMDMGVDKETEKRRERERYMEEAKLKVKDLTNKDNYAALFINSRKPQTGHTKEKQAEKPHDKRKPEEEVREAREKGANEKGNDKMDKQLQEAQRKRRELYEKQKRDAEKNKEKDKQERGRSRADSASGPSGRRRSVSRAGSNPTATTGTGRQRRSSLSRAPSAGPRTPSCRREKTRRSQVETDTVVDENPMALVLARHPPPIFKLRPATPPKSSIPAGDDDPFGPVAPTDTTRPDPKRTAFSLGAPFSSTAQKPTAPGKQPTKPMQRFDINTATRHSNFNPNVGSNKPNTGNTLNPAFNPQPRGGGPSSGPGGRISSPGGSSSGPSPISSSGYSSLFSGSGSGLGSSARPRAASGSGSGFGAATQSPTRTGRRIGGRARASSGSSSKTSMSEIMEDNLQKISNANANINPMALALGSSSGRSVSLGSLGSLGSSVTATTTTTTTDRATGSTTSPPEPEKQVQQHGRPVRKPVSKKRVEKKVEGRAKVARKPWLSDVAEENEDKDLDEEERIKVEVQGQGDGGDMVDGGTRIEELGDDDADFMVDDRW